MASIYVALQQNRSVASTSKTWNDVQDTTSSISDLNDENGTATGFSFSQSGAVETGLGMNDVGSGDAAWVDENNITWDAHYVNAASANFTFGSLNDSNTYDIELFGCWDTTSSNVMEVSQDSGFSTIHSDTMDVWDNLTDTLVWSGISPSSGSITIYWREVGGNGIVLLNAIKLTEVAGTSPKGPLGHPLHGPLGGPI